MGIVPVLLPVLLGILYIILMPIWYVLRCCHCCGGRKASMGRCKGLCCNNYDEKPSYVAGRKFCDSINFCKFLTFICFLLCAVAAVIGLAGNNMVDTGLRGTMDVTIYELRTLLQDGNTILSQMNSVAADMGALGANDMVAEVTGDQTCQLADLDKTVRDGEADISDTQDLVLDIRMLAVMVIFLVPLLFTFVFFITNLLQCCWCLTCLGALLILVPGLLSFISAGVHLSIALVTSDLCLEMDLHLHYYMDNATRHEPENLAFMPPDASSVCGASGDFAFVAEEINTKLDEVVQAGVDLIMASCNSDDTVGKHFTDCTAVTAFTGAYPNFARAVSVNRLTDIAAIANQLKLRNLGANAPTTVPSPITNAPKDVLTCLCESQTAYAARNNVDFQTAWDSSVDINGNIGYTTAETGCLTTWNTNPPGTDEILGCYAVTNPLVTLATCASSCTAGTDYKAMAENVTNMLTVSGDVVGRLNVLKTDSIDPILDCKFISEIFTALYYPLCVEANPGFTLITISNILSGVALILAFPIAVASTKRIKAKGADKYADDDMYKGQA